MFATPSAAGQRIGLFGGSFNPAHEGHLALSLKALKRLQLDWVWWMVSPQNPLKNPEETDDFETRFDLAVRLADHPRIIVCDFERKLATRTTAETLRHLAPVLRSGQFVWLMGADSFAGLHRWNDWRAIPATLPLAVFDRPGWSMRALHGPAAHSLARYRLPERDAARLCGARPPAWSFLSMPLRPESSTALRQRVQAN